MKKLLISVAAALICMSMASAVSADVIVEPVDEFYVRHGDEIESLYSSGREYVLSETVDVYADPDGKKTGTLSAGISPVITYYFTGKDGKKWGGYMGRGGEDELLWICVDGLELVYDNIAFTEEHKSEITVVNSTEEYASLRAEGAIYLFKYPMSTDNYAMESHPEDFGSYVSKVYTDDEGGKWGYIGYIWGIRDRWIYLDDPTDPAPRLDPEDVSAGAMMQASVYEETEGRTYTPALLLALGAAAGSAVLIGALRKNKKGGKN